MLRLTRGVVLSVDSGSGLLRAGGARGFGAWECGAEVVGDVGR